VVTARFAWDNVVNVHLALICATQHALSAITLEHAFALLAVTP
jgi:hypothetical protein